MDTDHPDWDQMDTDQMDTVPMEQQLGHSFEDRKLLLRALTHKSRVFEKSPNQVEKVEDNEQLEFLGDSILGFLASEVLLERFPEFPEGRLSKMKSFLVSASHLHEVAVELNLGEYLVLGRGEEMSGGREKKALLANAIEALIAAMYLDGGMEVTRKFVRNLVLGGLELLSDDDDLKGKDNKSSLQELAQSSKLPLPRYVVLEEHGPEHAKTFTVEVRVGKEHTAKAQGISKKEAGQRAAGGMIELLQQLPNASSQ